MTRKEREIYADKVLALGNISFGALVLGQFVGDHQFQWWAVSAGVVILIGAYIVAHLLLRLEDEEDNNATPTSARGRRPRDHRPRSRRRAR